MMTEQIYNVALLRKVREQILHHPGTHEQASWIKTVTLELPETPAGAAQYPTGKRYFRHTQKVACGTTACVAGWAVQLAGMEPVQGDIQAWADGVYTHQSFQVTEEPGAQPEPIRSVARRLLGLNETQADTLVDANNTRDYVLGSLANDIDIGEAQERAAARPLVLGGS